MKGGLHVYIDPRILEAVRGEFELVNVKTIPTSIYEKILIRLGFIEKSVKVKIKRRKFCELIPRVSFKKKYEGTWLDELAIKNVDNVHIEEIK